MTLIAAAAAAAGYGQLYMQAKAKTIGRAWNLRVGGAFSMAQTEFETRK